METLHIFVADPVCPAVASPKHTERAADARTQPNSRAATRVQRPRRAAFTLVEVLVSLGLLTMIASATTWGLSQINFSAASNRVYTNAETIAQNEIDKFLSAEPYSPRHIPDDGTAFPRTPSPLIPAELVTGAPPPSTVPIYSDGGNVVVTGSLTRVVADLGLTQTTNGKTDNLDARRLSVTLSYTFRGKAYQVALSTVRTSDF